MYFFSFLPLNFYSSFKKFLALNYHSILKGPSRCKWGLVQQQSAWIGHWGPVSSVLEVSGDACMDRYLQGHGFHSSWHHSSMKHLGFGYNPKETGKSLNWLRFHFFQHSRIHLNFITTYIKHCIVWDEWSIRTEELLILVRGIEKWWL